MSNYFGNNLNILKSWAPSLNKNISNLYIQYHTHNTIANYLNSPNANHIANEIRSNSLTQSLNEMNKLKGSITSMSSSIQNFDTFDIDSATTVSGKMDIGINTLDKYASLIDDMDNMINQVTDSIATLSDNVGDMLDNLENLDSFTDGISDKLINGISALPASVLNNILNIAIVQNLFSLDKRLNNLISVISSTIGNIKSPKSLKGLSALLRQISSLMESVRDEVKHIEKTAEEIKKLAENIDINYFLPLLTSIASGASFIERPTEFNPRYPYNQVHTTEGGHMFEIDNTPNAERLKLQHKTGTTVEVQSDGAVIAKTKNDMQLIIDNNGEIYVKGFLNIHVDGSSKIKTSQVLTLESDNNVVVSAPSIMSLSDGPVSIVGDYMNIVANESATISCNGETSVSSSDTLSLTSNKMINIDAPIVNIGNGTTNNVNINPNSSLMINSNGTNMIKSAGPTTINASLITLN